MKFLIWFLAGLWGYPFVTKYVQAWTERRA